MKFLKRSAFSFAIGAVVSASGHPHLGGVAFTVAIALAACSVYLDPWLSRRLRNR